MSENRDRSILPSRGGFFGDLLQRAKLIIRLMGDNRVSPLLKLIPIGTIAYLIFPLDIPGPIDDAAVIWLGLYLFVEMCPPDIVEEHLRALGRGSNTEKWDEKLAGEDDVIDGEYEEK
jgi:hypothetical protein